MAFPSPERWKQIRSILEHALDLPSPDARTAYLAEACGTDTVLREEVESLLKAEAEAGALLDVPIQNAAADLVEAASDQSSWATSLVGTSIGPYRLERCLGEGGMGLVFLAEREDFKQAVALKLIRPGYDTQEVVQRFLHERQILAGLTHPNIARLLDGGLTAEGRPFFVMEYVDGLPLHTYCDANHLSIQARLDLFCTVCDAVQYAHQNLIVHRDLKPSNILVTPDGIVKLLDFGIAKVVEPTPAQKSHAPLTRTGLRLMTPEYASPEQIRGETITTASDVYALGVLLYELLTGHRPYRIASRLRHEVERIILEEEPTRPSTALTHVQSDDTAAEKTRVRTTRGLTVDQLRRRLQGDLDTIILMAMRKETHRRYQSVQQLGADIRRHVGGLPVQAQKDTLGYRMRKFVTRHRMGVAASVLVACSVLGGLGVAAWQGQKAARERDSAQREAAKAQQVSAFMVDFFKSADPFGVKGDSLLARDLLEAGVRRTEVDLTDQPGVQATLYSALGNTYRSLGNRGQADSLFQTALALRQEVYGDESLEVAASLFDLGQLRYMQSEYEVAEKYLREALDLRLRYLPEDHVDVGRTYQVLGELVNDAGALDEAIVYYKRALPILEQQLGPEHFDVARSLVALGSAYRSRNKLALADSLVSRAIEINRVHLGGEHPYLSTSLHELGNIKVGRGDMEAAKSAYREAIRVKEKQLGPNGAIGASVSFALLLRQEGDLKEAESLLQKGYDYYVNTFGPGHRYALITMNNLGRLRVDQGRYEEAERFFQQAIAGKEVLLGRVHWSTTVSLYHYANLLHKLGRFAEAETLFRDVVDIRRQLYPDGHHTLGSALAALGQLLLETERFEAAEPVFEEALTLFEAFTDSLDGRRGNSQSALGAAVSGQQRFAEAELLLLAGYNQLMARPRSSDMVEAARARLHAHYTAWGRPEDAARYALQPE